jgi:hypothetical protein
MIEYRRGGTAVTRAIRYQSFVQHLGHSDIGMGLTRSMWMCRKRVAGSVKSPKGVTVFLETLEHWQARA